MNYLQQSIVLAGILFTAVTGNAQSGDWLSGLPDNVAVRELSIPGAHDAATGNGFAGSSSLGANSRASLSRSVCLHNGMQVSGLLTCALPIRRVPMDVCNCITVYSRLKSR